MNFNNLVPIAHRHTLLVLSASFTTNRVPIDEFVGLQYLAFIIKKFRQKHASAVLYSKRQHSTPGKIKIVARALVEKV